MTFNSPWPLDGIDSEVWVVRAEPSHLEEVESLLEEAAAWTRARGIRYHPPGAFRASRDRLARAIDAGEFFLAVHEAQPVGTMRLAESDPQIWPVLPEGSLVLHSLAVSRAWSGRAVGRALLRWAEDFGRAQGFRWIRLDCPAQNAVLRAYYGAAGYQPVDEVEVELDGEHWVLCRFQKPLG